MPSNTPGPVTAHLAHIVAERAPRRLLLIGVHNQTRSEIVEAAPPECAVVALEYGDIEHTSLADQERFDIAIVTHTLELLAPAEARLLLGRLRDMLTRCVVAGVTAQGQTTGAWTIADFIAMGFRRSPGSRDLDADWSLYRFDIHDYKTTPNWLSSRYWANPKRWDEERW